MLRVLGLTGALLFVACNGGPFAVGAVETENGTPIPGATVRLARSDGQVTMEAASSQDGCFALGLISGPLFARYQLAVEAPGYKAVRADVPRFRRIFIRAVLAASDGGKDSQIIETGAPPCGQE